MSCCAYVLAVTCMDCGAPTELVQTRATLDGSESVAVVACSVCRQGKRQEHPVEFVVSMQMRRMPRAPGMSRHDSYHPMNEGKVLVGGFGSGG